MKIFSMKRCWLFVFMLGILGLVGLTRQQNVDAKLNVDPGQLDQQQQPQTQRLKPSINPSVEKQLAKVGDKSDYIFLNTIDGLLYAIGKHDGQIKWSLKEDAVLKFPKNYENPYFLTDPRDGSLYIFNKKDGLKKFPFTIAELVSASPSKSSDGFLYTGDKKDQWLAIDYRTGIKLDTLTSETLLTQISTSDENIVYIGRTEYTISMFDISTRRKIFNLTYYDYSTHASKERVSRPTTQKANINVKDSDKDLNAYPYYHFSSSSDGTLVTLDRKTGDLRWQLKLEHPIVAIYRYENEQLYKINFAIFAVEALTDLVDNPSRHKLLYKEQIFREQENYSQQVPVKPIDQQQQQQSTTPSPPSNKIGSTNVFMSTLYIGYYKNNLYAMPALVYNWKVPEIEGPKPVTDPTIVDPVKSNTNKNDNKNLTLINNDSAATDSSYSSGEFANTNTNLMPINDDEKKEETNTIVIGHHKLPDKFDLPPNYIQPNDKLIVMFKKEGDQFGYLQDIFNGGLSKQPSCPVDKKSRFKELSLNYWNQFDQLMSNKYIWSLITVIIASIFPLVKTIQDCKRRRRRQQSNIIDSDDEELVSNYTHITNNSGSGSQNGKNSSGSKHNTRNSRNSRTTDDDSSRLHSSMSLPEISPDGMIRIGKISYDPKEVLGHGCGGTYVYKGTFENRQVAVKRILPDCYTFADREVDLLRDADQHGNVLRYFCTESDVQFRYIALELCQMTLYDYVHMDKNVESSKLISKQPLRDLTILEQASKGLDHLHTLGIVHRDIKPQNVLLSYPDSKGQVIAMISDFGLCKRLELGFNSFSKRSGLTGTEGWIAPELLEEYIHDHDTIHENPDKQKVETIDCESKSKRKRVTKAVDIFSMGCVYYYVLSDGNHPFGESFRRQPNIESNNYKLDKFIATKHMDLHIQKQIIEKMISNDPECRPTTKQILAHPLFWSKAKILQFLQDVSDRIEKIEPDDKIVLELEKSANSTLKNNWKTHICIHLQNDLKKFRQYNGVSVRDLLRAIRNKKHHYRELPDEVKQSLGPLPDGFVDYFMYRFPKLLMHVYEAMKCCSNEAMLDVYYNVE